MLNYEELFTNFRKGIRNGNWKGLRFLDKALYRAAMWYLRHSGSIVNEMLVEKLSSLVERLKETKGMRILKRGICMGTEVEGLVERSRLHILVRDDKVNTELLADIDDRC